MIVRHSSLLTYCLGSTTTCLSFQNTYRVLQVIGADGKSDVQTPRRFIPSSYELVKSLESRLSRLSKQNVKESYRFCIKVDFPPGLSLPANGRVWSLESEMLESHSRWCAVDRVIKPIWSRFNLLKSQNIGNDELHYSHLHPLLNNVLLAPSPHPSLEEPLKSAFRKLIGSWGLTMTRYPPFEGEWHLDGCSTVSLCKTCGSC